MKKFRNCEVMQYLDHFDIKDPDLARKAIFDRAQKITCYKTASVVIHDKDKDKDGKPKGPHFHLVLQFTNSVLLSTISKSIGVPENFVQDISTTTTHALRYLIHADDPSKYQYSADDVLSSFDYKAFIGINYDDLPNAKESSIDPYIQDILDYKIRAYNRTLLIPKDLLFRYKTQFDRAFAIQQEAIEAERANHSRELQCIYITGAAGSGKTSFAKWLCKQKGFSFYVSSGGKNPLDNYQGEDAIILDDLRGSTFSFDALLKLTDNNTSSLAGARYYDKSLAFCVLIIATSIKDLEELYPNAASEGEPLSQLQRRFVDVYKIEKSLNDTPYIYYYRYNKTSSRYEYFDYYSIPEDLFSQERSGPHYSFDPESIGLKCGHTDKEIK